MVCSLLARTQIKKTFWEWADKDYNASISTPVWFLSPVAKLADFKAMENNFSLTWCQQTLGGGVNTLITWADLFR